MKPPTCCIRAAGLILFAGIAGLLAGCAGPASTTARPAFVGSDYTYVYVTGSHIPLLVPKSPTARMAPTISPLAILTPDDVRRVMAPTPLPMH